MPVKSRRGGVPTLVFLITIVITLAALFAPGWWGALPLLAGAAYLGYLLLQRWRSLPAQVVALRTFTILLFVGFAIYKIA